jgi:hypothetical protein
MPSTEPPLTMLDEDAIRAAALNSEPYPFSFVEHAIDPALEDRVLADAPAIPDRGSYGLPALKFGAAFGAVVQDLLSPRFRRVVEDRFDMDLSRRPPCIVMMGNTTGHYNEGHAHNDSKHKIVTVLLGFSREWPYQRGRLRVLRSNNLDDCAFEFPPEFGRMLMFRVSEKSWHGFLPQKARRMSLQLCYVDSDAYVRSEYWRHSVSAFAKRMPALRTMLDWAPKRI